MFLITQSVFCWPQSTELIRHNQRVLHFYWRERYSRHLLFDNPITKIAILVIIKPKIWINKTHENIRRKKMRFKVAWVDFRGFQLVAVPHKVWELAPSPFPKTLANGLHSCIRERWLICYDRWLIDIIVVMATWWYYDL